MFYLCVVHVCNSGHIYLARLVLEENDEKYSKLISGFNNLICVVVNLIQIVN